MVAGCRGRYSYLLVVTQKLERVESTGVPEADYNDGLASFDSDLIRELEVDGLVVVVETFAGKRNYYAYVADKDRSTSRAESLLSRCGMQSITSFRGGPDPAWRFYDRYCKDVQ
jgi:hypothetical protein